MTAGAPNTDSVLACGVRLGELLELVADGPDAPAGAGDGIAEHARSCQHCRSALAELDGQWEPIRSAGSQAVPTPPGLVARVLSSVRAMRGSGGGKPLAIRQERGQLRITERALVTFVQELASRLAGREAGVHVSTVAMTEEGVQVLVAARYGVPADAEAARLRQRLEDELASQFGDAAPTVSVHITDVR